MKKTIGCFTQEKLEELAAQPHVTVMQPTHDIVYEPWAADTVMQCCDKIVAHARQMKSREVMRTEDPQIEEFASKYTILFDKISDIEFISNSRNLETVKHMIMLRAMVENKIISEDEAKARCSDIALKGLMAGVRDMKNTDS